MKFRRHAELEGRHAFLSPSKPAWLNYSDERLLEALDTSMTAALGSRLHELAKELILLGIKLPNTSQTLNMYVNDAIGYRMQPEVSLVASINAFGTADAIDFDEEHQMLRIFDLKNGTSTAKEYQLETYAAYFCIEYGVRPLEIGYDLRIYQNDAVQEFNTDPQDILFIMDQVKHFDKLIREVKGE